MAKTIYDYKVAGRDGESVDLAKYKGKVLVIVNTATGCGFTPQYKGLEELYQKYKGQGLEILDFPCDQFGHQAPGSDAEIHEFCTANYHTTFPRFKKIEVLGDKAEPLFRELTVALPDEEVTGVKNKIAMKAIDKLTATAEPGHVRWNFTKFLVDREGRPVRRFAPTTEPKEMEETIKELL